MFKYIASVILAYSCIVVSASAQQEYTFDFQRLNSGESLSEAPWYLQPSHFVNGNTYSYSIKTGETTTNTLSMTWDGATMATGGNHLIQFTDSGNSPSTITFDFGGMTVDEITFTVYGLQGTNGNVGGLFKINGVDGGDIRSTIKIAGTQVPSQFEHLQELTSASGHGFYQRTGTNNQNGKEVAIITIYAPMTSLELYFESRAYQISSLSFKTIPQAPEPATYAALVGLAIAGVAILRRRKA